MREFKSGKLKSGKSGNSGIIFFKSLPKLDRSDCKVETREEASTTILDFREVFNLSNTQFGSLYSVATILSALTIIWAGKLIDTVSLKKYTLAIVLGLSITCFFASVVFNVVLLFFVIYFLRLFGQGLMGHTSRTTMARYFKANRGKALAISGFGFSFGEMIYPFIVVILILTFGWRITWFSSSIFILLFFGVLLYLSLIHI